METSETIKSTPFGALPDGQPVQLFTLRNRNGMEARIADYGGIVVSLTSPDREGRFADVVLGFDKLEDYLKFSPYFGAIIGRYGNRIANASFTLDGKVCKLAANNGPNTLHGGIKGFDKVVWKARAYSSTNGPALELTYLSKDGEEGFPGNLNVKVIYTATDDNALRADFEATTDKLTVVNLTHHSYFNLGGKGDVLTHEALINAKEFTPVDATMIPTGELRPVAGTPFDFNHPTAIGARINHDDEQLKLGEGYDHNYVIAKPSGELGLVARVFEPGTGRVMEAFSTEPGVQFYTGNHLNGATGKNGVVYKKRSGFCFEPQHFPDSPNHPDFPSTELKPGQIYRSTTIYKFSAR